MHWITCLEGGPRRVNHAAAAVGKLIYSFGGYCTGEDSKEFTPMDVHILCTEILRWVYLPLLEENSEVVPFKRYGHTAVAYGKHIYIWGGRNDELACNVLYCFDTVTNSWSVPDVSGTIPSARDGHSACLSGHHMYIFGGFEADQDAFSQDVYELDLQQMRWAYVLTLGIAPSFRDFHSAVAMEVFWENRMYIFGGRGDCGDPYNRYEEVYSSNVHYLDIETGRWHVPFTFGDRPTGRRSHSAFVHGGYMYIFGGYNGMQDQHYNEMYRFDPKTSVWMKITPFGTPPCERRRQSCIVVNNRMYLFGGTSPKMRTEKEEMIESDDYETTDLMDHSDLHVLDFSPSLRTLSMLVVINYNLDTTCLPVSLQYEIMMMRTPNTISTPLEDIAELNINC